MQSKEHFELAMLDVLGLFKVKRTRMPSSDSRSSRVNAKAFSNLVSAILRVRGGILIL